MRWNTHGKPENVIFNEVELAEYLGMSRSFLRVNRTGKKVCAEDRIPFIRMGSRAIRYRKKDVDAYMAARVIYPED